MNNNTNSSCCINDILRVINVLQNQAEKIDDIPNTCDRPFLGLANNSNTFVYNTRPITLYTSNNTLFEAPYTLWLFALHRGSVLTSYLGKGALIYDCKILQNDVLVREFVPVYRKSDSVVGLYDIQNGVFYSNANNSGDDFTAGPNVS